MCNRAVSDEVLYVNYNFLETTATSSQVFSLSLTQDLKSSYLFVGSTSTVLIITPELTTIPKRKQEDVPVLLAAVCATGVIIGLLILVIVVLMMHHTKTRKKAKRYKIGEYLI